MVLAIAHDDIPSTHDSDAFQPLELAISRPPRPESPQEGAIRMKDLNAVVAGVSHYDVALVVYCYTPGKRRKLCCRSFCIEITIMDNHAIGLIKY